MDEANAVVKSVQTAAALCQLAVLRAANRVKPEFRRFPLFYPALILRCDGWLPLVSYREVFVQRIYEPPVLLNAPQRILDIGGHIGLAALFFATRFPGARITVYEANPDAIGPLRNNIRRFTDRISLEAAAVGPREGSASIFIEACGGIPTDASTVNRVPGKVGREERVNMVDIRRIAERGVDLLKLDIEGAEYDCLEALAPTPDRIGTIVAEFHNLPEDLGRLNRICEDLVARGYRLLDPEGASVPLPLLNSQPTLVLWLTARR